MTNPNETHEPTEEEWVYRAVQHGIRIRRQLDLYEDYWVMVLPTCNFTDTQRNVAEMAAKPYEHEEQALAAVGKALNLQRKVRT